MKVLILGGGGMLGHKLTQIFRDKFDTWATLRGKKERYDCFDIFDPAQTFENLDVADFLSLAVIIEKLKPEVIVNAVGIVKQISTSKSVIQTLSINSVFPHRLAELAFKIRARLITVSTDCVFSGKKGNYTESDGSDAEDLYGKSKNLGEVIEGDALTLRTSIIGRELDTSHSLVEWFLSNEGKSVKGYTKAIFSGFPTLVLASIIADLIENHPDLKGLYHVSSDPINKYDLLKLLKKDYRANIEIEPFGDFEIDRSLDSTKFREATGFKPIRWERMIKMMAADNGLYKR